MPNAIPIRKAARMLQITEQAVRELIKNDKIPGACCWGSKKHLNYYITDEQVSRFMKGEVYAKGFEN